MKFWTALAPMAVLLLVVGCGGKKENDSTSSPKDGFDSPKALMDELLELQKKGSPGIVDIVKYMSPLDRESMALQMMVTADLMASFGDKKEDSLKAVKDLRTKFNIPEKVEGVEEGKLGEVMEDKAKVKEVSARYFKDVDTKIFLVELFGLDHMKELGEEGGPLIKEVKEIKEDGDKATVVMLLDNGKDETQFMVKVDGRWYLKVD